MYLTGLRTATGWGLRTPNWSAYDCRRCTALLRGKSQSTSLSRYREFISASIIPSLPTQDHPGPARKKLLSSKPAKLEVWSEKTKQNQSHKHTHPPPNPCNPNPNRTKTPQPRDRRQIIAKGWALFCCLRHLNAAFIHFRLFPATELLKHFVSPG